MGAVLVGIVFVTFGCTTSYRVDVTGYLNSAQSLSLVPGKKIFIEKNPQVSNPLLEQEVAHKIGRILRQQGYITTSLENADFRLTFSYGMDRGPVRMESVRRPQTVRTYDPDTAKTSYSTVYTYEPSSVQLFTRSLSVRVLDAGPWRESHIPEIVWAADTVSEGTSSDLREMLDYLLVATFEYFGKDTGKAQRVDLKPADLRIMRLKEP